MLGLLDLPAEDIYELPVEDLFQKVLGYKSSDEQWCSHLVRMVDNATWFDNMKFVAFKVLVSQYGNDWGKKTLWCGSDLYEKLERKSGKVSCGVRLVPIAHNRHLQPNDLMFYVGYKRIRLNGKAFMKYEMEK